MERVAHEAIRLDKFLAGELPGVSRSAIARTIDLGLVSVDGVSRKPSFLLRPGSIVLFDLPENREPHSLEPAPEIGLDVPYEDDYLLIVNKPRGLVVHPAPSVKSPTLVHALLARSHSLSSVGGSFRPGIVHRLDKDTTGLMLIAKTDEMHQKLSEGIQMRSVSRVYVCVVRGDVPEENFKVQAPIARSKQNRLKMAVDAAGRDAITHFRLLKRLDVGSLLSATLKTGRTHQIRVHLSAMGYPVLGDAIYSPVELRNVPLQLHSWKLAFAHPASGEQLEVFCPPPSDFIGREFV